MNNVDLREGFALSGGQVVLVTASNRTDDSIAIYRLDTAARRLVDVADGVQPTASDDTYGLCMYRSARHGAMYVFITGDDTGTRPTTLVAAGNGRVLAARRRRVMSVSPTRGFGVADDIGDCVVQANACRC